MVRGMSNRVNLVKEAYREILKREGDEKGVEAYVSSKKSLKEIRQSLVSSKEYKDRVEPVIRNLEADSHKKKVLLFGAFGNGNLGDAIQADYVSKGLLEAGFEGEIWATSSLKKHYNYSYGKKLPSWVITSHEILSYFDLILVGGGGLLSHPHYPLNKEDWAKELKTKIAVVSVGATNFAVNESALLLQKSIYVSARDKTSYSCLKKLRSDTEFVKDPVLSMMEVNERRGEGGGSKGRTLWVLKGPLESVHYKIRDIVSTNDIVVGFEKDVDFDIEKLFPEIVYTPTIESFNNLACQCNRFFSMRYHGLIASLAFSDNVFAIGDQKNKVLLEEVGMPSRFLEKNDLPYKIENSTASIEDCLEKLAFFRSNFIASLSVIISNL